MNNQLITKQNSNTRIIFDEQTIYENKLQPKTIIQMFHQHQIGGCVVVISYGETRIIIDFGKDLPGINNKFPIAIEGITYKKQESAKEYKNEYKYKYKYEAVFFTHSHGDHMGRICDILPGIPLYMGEATKLFQQTIAKYTRNQQMTKLLNDSTFVHTFSPNKTITIGNIKVTPYMVDHSAYDSYMFLIETPDKRVLHTGDFRFHGYRGKAILPMIEHYITRHGKYPVDVLITEGTMFGRVKYQDDLLADFLEENKGHKLKERGLCNDMQFTGKTKKYSEQNLYEDACHFIKENRYVFVLCSSMNLDTIASFYHAAKENHRGVYANDYVVEQMQNFSKTAGKYSGIYEFENVHAVNFDKQLISGWGWHGTQEDLMRRYGFVIFITKGNGFYENWVSRFSDLNPKVIYSMWDGYLDEKRACYNREMKEFCNHTNAVFGMHTSGHAYPDDIYDLISKVNPRDAIIPIHMEKEHVDSFQRNIGKKVVTANVWSS